MNTKAPVITMTEFMKNAKFSPTTKEPESMTPIPNGGIHISDEEVLMQKFGPPYPKYPRRVKSERYMTTRFEIVLSDKYTNEWGGKSRWLYKVLVGFVTPSVGLIIDSDPKSEVGNYTIGSLSFRCGIYNAQLPYVLEPTNPQEQCDFLIQNGWKEETK